MRHLLAAALSLIVTAAAAEPRTPVCHTYDQDKASLLSVAAKKGANNVVLDGDEAHRFIDVVNKTGTPTAFKGDHVMVLYFDGSPTQILLIFGGRCGGISVSGTIGIDVFRKAYIAARHPISDRDAM